jgi:uncharacterized protein (TIGR03437 family)
MGVVLLSCIMKNATTKARTTFCSSPPLPRLSPVGNVASVVENASAAYSGTTTAPHEYFDQTGNAASVQFAGLAPGYAGLYQVNVLVPPLPAGQYPLQISVGGVLSNAAMITVR